MEIAAAILETLGALGQMIPSPLEGKYGWGHRMRGQITGAQYKRGIRHLGEMGMVRVITKRDKHFIKITRAGQLEILLIKAKRKINRPWDGKWRLIIFDIPENSKEKREFFRKLLKTNGFYKLQASVYICPQDLNKAAIEYLNKTGLSEYIRIFRADKMDSDKDLKKHFSLK